MGESVKHGLEAKRGSTVFDIKFCWRLRKNWAAKTSCWA